MLKDTLYHMLLATIRDEREADEVSDLFADKIVKKIKEAGIYIPTSQIALVAFTEFEDKELVCGQRCDAPYAVIYLTNLLAIIVNMKTWSVEIKDVNMVIWPRKPLTPEKLYEYIKA